MLIWRYIGRQICPSSILNTYSHILYLFRYQIGLHALYGLVCVGHLSKRPWEIVDRAIEFGCEKVQLFKPYFNQEMIDKAHKHGIKCNVFWSDDEDETKKFLEMGIDTILTNDYNLISQVVKK